MTFTETQTIEKSLAALIKNYSEYNAWANNQLVNWLKTKPEALIEKEAASGFPSIKLTLAHILKTQQFWHKAIQNEKFDGEDFEGTVSELFEALTNHSNQLAAYVNTLSEDSLKADCELVTPWFTSNLAVFEYVVQVMNHSTYHRGQITTIGRQLGLTGAPNTDYNMYNVVKG